MAPLTPGRLWRNVIAKFVEAFVVLSIGLTLFQWVYSQDKTVPFWVLYVVVAIALSAIWSLSLSLNDVWSAEKRLLPELTAVLPLSEDKVRLLATSSKLFGHGSAVSVFHLSKGFELLLAIGVVETVTESGNLQIIVGKIDGSDPAVWSGIKNNASDSMKSIIIRPSIRRDLLLEQGGAF